MRFRFLKHVVDLKKCPNIEDLFIMDLMSRAGVSNIFDAVGSLKNLTRLCICYGGKLK